MNNTRISNNNNKKKNQRSHDDGFSSFSIMIH